MFQNEARCVYEVIYFILESDRESLRDRPVDRDRRVGDHWSRGSPNGLKWYTLPVSQVGVVMTCAPPPEAALCQVPET